VALTYPSNCSNPRAVTRNEDDDNDNQQHTRPANLVTLNFEGMQVDRNVREGNGGNDQANAHAQYSDKEDHAAAELIDNNQVDPREDEVRR
jgi:hypothetical protein